MKRVKKPKKPISDRPAKSPMDIVAQSNYLCLAVTVRNLKMVYDWDKEQLDEFCEGYAALMAEVGSRRTNIPQFIRDTKILTGIDVKKLLDDAVRR